MRSALEVIGVDFVFRVGFWLKPVKILNGVSLKVPEHSVFGFLGANGAGKTSLIHLMTGLRKPTSGQVFVFGHHADTPLARSKIGYLPERPYFHDHLTCEGVLEYYGTLSGMSRVQIRERILKVLSIVGMAHARKFELKSCSKGMLQRIGIAQALIHDPEFLVLDEPMSGLDPLGRKEIRELIVYLAGKGKTIFFSSHVIPDVEAICDQVALIEKGKLIESGPLDAFLSQGTVRTEIGFSEAPGLPRLEKGEDWTQFPEFISIQRGPQCVRGWVEGQQKVDQVLFKLTQRKVNILWVTPIRPSLEDRLMKDSSRVHL